MRRRTFLELLAVTVASWPAIALAQVPTKRPLIAVVIGASQAVSQRWVIGLPQGLQELGYLEGRDYEIEYRYADGDLTRQPVLLDELIRHKPNVIVVGNTTAAFAAKQATTSIPIIVASSVDPVSLGLVASQARPQGNLTGIISTLGSLVGKQLEFGFELTPGAKRAGMLMNANASSAPNAVLRQGVETAAQAMAVNLISVEVRTRADIDSAFQTLARERVNIVIVVPDAMLLNERIHIAELAIATQLPVVYGLREHVEDGGLLSYGVDLHENWRRAAAYVDKILKGAKPADLPIEQPTKFELVINLKTAKALGLTIPEAFLLRADEVIE
jgi:putative ABC transport system substrate-binding protein